MEKPVKHSPVCPHKKLTENKPEIIDKLISNESLISSNFSL